VRNVTIILGDCRTILPTLDAGSVRCCDVHAMAPEEGHHENCPENVCGICLARPGEHVEHGILIASLRSRLDECAAKCGSLLLAMADEVVLLRSKLASEETKE
jgi:hypothetical protein